MMRLRAVALIVAPLLFALSGCGGSSQQSSSGAAPSFSTPTYSPVPTTSDVDGPIVSGPGFLVRLPHGWKDTTEQQTLAAGETPSSLVLEEQNSSAPKPTRIQVNVSMPALGGPDQIDQIAQQYRNDIIKQVNGAPAGYIKLVGLNNDRGGREFAFTGTNAKGIAQIGYEIVIFHGGRFYDLFELSYAPKYDQDHTQLAHFNETWRWV